MIAAAQTQEHPRSRLRALRTLRRVSLGRYTGVLLGFAAIFVYLAITEPVFLTWENWQNIFRSQAVVFTLGVGMTFVVLTGGIDLSIASAATGCAMLLGIVVRDGGAWWLGALTAIAVGIGFGAANGAMIGILRIPFFVVTLGTLSIYSSIALLSTSGATVSLFTYPRFNEIPTLINGSVGPFPTVLLLGAALYGIGAFVLRYTAFGRAVYAVGANPEAARLTGINVGRLLIGVYLISGLTAGLAAIVQTGRLTAAGPQVDPNLLLTVIAAVLIGGTAFTGGDGGLLGTIIGVLFLGLIQNGLQLSDISTFWQGTVSGSILIIAVGLGVVRDYGVRARMLAARRRQSVGADRPSGSVLSDPVDPQRKVGQ